MEIAKRIKHLPPYLFAEIDRKIQEKKDQGVDVISLGIGDPVEPTPQHIIDRLCKEAGDQKTHRYPSYFGLPEFRKEIANWYRRRSIWNIDYEKEVLPLIGSKEGISHIFLGLVDEGETVLIPDPGYPVYQSGAILAGGEVQFVPLLERNDYNPDLSLIDPKTLKKAKVLFLNYPNNPTAAVADTEVFQTAVELAKKYDFVICHDFAYAEIAYDGYIAPSIMGVPGAKDVAVEFGSLSKTYNMTGWRCGWVVGNKKVIEALGRIKTNIDSGIFNAIQYAGIEALSSSQICVDEMCEVYRHRRNLVVDTLNRIGLKTKKPLASVFVWTRVPNGYTSSSFAEHILEKTGVVVSPGNAYGPSGEGFIRVSLTVEDDRLQEALERITANL